MWWRKNSKLAILRCQADLLRHRLRQQLKDNDKTIPNQVGKPIQNPTIRRIFQVFEGIDVLIVKEQNLQKPLIVNLAPIHLKNHWVDGQTYKKFIESQIRIG